MYRKRLMAAAAAGAFLSPALSAHAQIQNAQTQLASNRTIETVVVTASPVAADIDQFATITGKVDRDEILQSGGGNLADALATVPGVSSSGFAAGASRPIIRGFDSTRVRVLEDGTSSADVSDIGPDHGVPIDPLSAQSIEVVRGAATLRYGSQAIGGVVNAINNRVPMTLPDQTPLSVEVTGTYASNANLDQTSVMTDAGAGPFAFHADGFYRHADDYGTPLGTMPNSFFQGGGYSLGSSYFFGEDNGSHIGGALIGYNAKYGIPDEDSFIDMRQMKGMGRAVLDIGRGPLTNLNVDASYADYAHQEILPDGTAASTFRNREWDMRAEQLFDAIGPLANSAIGVQIQNRAFSALGEGADYLSPTLTNSQAMFVFTDMPIGGSLHMQASGRLEHVRIKGTPSSNIGTVRDFLPLSAAVGALYDLNDAIKLGLTASTAARAPAQTELFARGPHDGPQTFETGDPALKMERSNSLEGTLRAKYDVIDFEGSLWSSWFNHFIYGALTGRMCNDAGDCLPSSGGDLKELLYRQQGAHYWGAEAKAAIPLWKPEAGQLDANLQGDFVRATLSDGGNVPRIPPYRIGGGLSWTSDAFDAGFLFLFAGRQDEFGQFDTPTPSYVALDAHIAWRPFTNSPGVEFLLAGHNLTNAVQRNAAAMNKDDVVRPGRDVRFVMRLATN